MSNLLHDEIKRPDVLSVCIVKSDGTPTYNSPLDDIEAAEYIRNECYYTMRPADRPRNDREVRRKAACEVVAIYIARNDEPARELTIRELLPLLQTNDHPTMKRKGFNTGESK